MSNPPTGTESERAVADRAVASGPRSWDVTDMMSGQCQQLISLISDSKVGVV